MEKECIFKFKYDGCEHDKTDLQTNKTQTRVHTIINASRQYGDGLYDKLEKCLQENETLTVYYHKNCVSRYTSKTNIPSRPPLVALVEEKKLRRCYSTFNFKEQCLYCGG